MKELQRIVVLCLIPLAVVLFFIFRGESENYEIKSSDEILILDIPKSSLPDDISNKDITIDLVEDQEGRRVYSLSPDGLEFKEPITLTFDVDLPDMVDGEYPVPLLVHQSGEGENIETEVVNDSSVIFDLDNERMIVAGNISHFSNIALWEVGNLFSARITSSGPRSHRKNEQFQMNVEVRPYNGTHVYRDNFGYDEFSYARGATWGIEGQFQTSYARYIQPEEQDIDRRTGLTLFQTYEAVGNFECVVDNGRSENVGLRKATINFTINQKRWSTFGGTPSLLREENHSHNQHVGISERHTCVAEDATPTPTDVYSPTPASADPRGLNCPEADLLSQDLGGVPLAVNKLKDGKCYPKDQFSTPSNVDRCREVHYHTTLRSIDNHFRNDSDPCGAAVMSDIVESGTIWVRP